MHLRGFSRWYFSQVWLVFNLGVHCIFCVKLIYSRKTCHFDYVFNVNPIFKIYQFWGKITNFTPKIISYLLAWQFQRLFWNKLAKNVRICILKNSVEPFMLKSYFFLNKGTKTCWSHLNSPDIRQFFLSFRWNK